MKLVIDGREYDGSAQPFLGDLRRMTKVFGFGYGTVIKRLKALSVDADITDLLDDPDFVDALIAWMWMSRLRAGERELTAEQAGMVAMDNLRMIADDDDAPVAEPPDPQSAPTGSGRGSGAARPPASSSTSGSMRTSKPPSARG